jgi:hypothetical protein
MPGRQLQEASMMAERRRVQTRGRGCERSRVAAALVRSFSRFDVRSFVARTRALLCGGLPRAEEASAREAESGAAAAASDARETSTQSTSGMLVVCSVGRARSSPAPRPPPSQPRPPASSCASRPAAHPAVGRARGRAEGGTPHETKHTHAASTQHKSSTTHPTHPLAV